MSKTAEEIKKEIISKILEEANGSWKDLAEDGYDEGFKQGQFAAPPPASEGEIADSKKVFDALVAIANNERLIADSVGDPILREMHLETQKAAQRICRTIYGATLPTREPEANEKFAVRFSEWLMIQCDYKNHCVWEYQGEEYTQQELIEIFKRMTLPSPPNQSPNQ